MLYLFGVLAACMLGLGFVLQQHAARNAPLSDMLSFRLLLDLVKVPLWLAGIGCMVAGQIFSVLALSRGDLSRVEPLLATNLLFAMVLARWLSGERLGVSGWAGVLLLSGGVTAFIIAGAPHSGPDDTGSLRHWLVLGGVLGIALLLVLTARHLKLVKEPPLLAAAAGVLYGLQDALTRVSSSIAEEHGLARLLVSWEPYVIVVLAVTGLMLVQSAFEAGPLRMSLPALTAAEPLAGIACGIGFLGDRIRVTPGALAGEFAGLAAVVAGVFLLGRHPAMPTGSHQEGKPTGSHREAEQPAPEGD
ncbi:DMT family transporter [Streptomyces sp. NPDC042319]|uniref:DMT family transporter n=1 Tax=Streptomyces sp. NPDC042319 TaxID=3154332 RepID=UPI0033D3E7CE